MSAYVLPCIQYVGHLFYASLPFKKKKGGEHDDSLHAWAYAYRFVDRESGYRWADVEQIALRMEEEKKREDSGKDSNRGVLAIIIALIVVSTILMEGLST